MKLTNLEEDLGRLQFFKINLQVLQQFNDLLENHICNSIRKDSNFSPFY